MILITGATGFVGRNLVAKLLKEGHRLRCLVRDPVRAASLFGDKCDLAPGDVTLYPSIQKAITPEIEAAIHLVGILREERGVKFHSVHVDGTRNVVRSLREAGVKRYLHISALGTRAGAMSLYHKTKWEAEEIVRASGLNYTIFRPSVLFGAQDKFTNLFSAIIRKMPAVGVPGSGKMLMQPLFVGDLTALMAFSLNEPDTIGKVFEVGGPRRYTFDAIIDIIAKVMGRRVIKFHMPLSLMGLGAFAAECLLKKPPITRAELVMLKEDNVTDETRLFEMAGIKPVGLEEGLKSYLH